MKKLLSLALVLMLSLSACSNKVNKQSESSNEATKTNEVTTNKDKVTIKTYNGENVEVDLEVAFNPSKIAVLDLPALDILDNLGLGDRVIGAASNRVDYLAKYNEKRNLGTIREADLEALAEIEPDVIFIGGRMAKSYDELSKIAPVIYLKVDHVNLGTIKSVEKNAMTIASLFGLESKVSELMANFQSRLDKIAAFANQKTAIVALTTSGSFNILGQDGRASIISREANFKNIGLDAPKKDKEQTATHGNEASFEFVVEKNPEFIFVLDRDVAINAKGGALAKEIVENELVKGLDVYKNGNIVYLSHPTIWYTAEGGITALDYMLKDLEQAIK